MNGLGLVQKTEAPPRWRPLEWRGLHFPNRLGIAGGVDKDARNIRTWWALGAGFVEIGTVTPLPQPGNTPPVVGRDVRHEAMWNRLGFPSQGIARVAHRLDQMPRPHVAPIFANIGKNAATPLESAANDYIQGLKALRGKVEAFVVNISSPNTKGLRDLLHPERLREFLAPVLAEKREPILLKLSPDMSPDEVERVLAVSHDLGVDGWVLTNTSQDLRDGLDFPREGGVSGRPLRERSREFLALTLATLGERRHGRLVVSVGGVMTEDDVWERLDMGADLVQVYSALVFAGPYFLRRVAKCRRTQAEA